MLGWLQSPEGLRNFQRIAFYKEHWFQENCCSAYIIECVKGVPSNCCPMGQFFGWSQIPRFCCQLNFHRCRTVHLRERVMCMGKSSPTLWTLLEIGTSLGSWLYVPSSQRRLSIPFSIYNQKSTEFRPTNLGTASYQPLRSSSDFTSQNWLLIDKFRVMEATSSSDATEPISILLRRALSEIEISPAREIRFHRGNCRFSSADTHFIPPSDNIKGILLLPLRVSFGELFAASKFIVRVESNRRKAASFESSRAAAPIGKQVNITLPTFLSLGCAPKAIGRA